MFPFRNNGVGGGGGGDVFRHYHAQSLRSLSMSASAKPKTIFHVSLFTSGAAPPSRHVHFLCKNGGFHLHIQTPMPNVIVYSRCLPSAGYFARSWPRSRWPWPPRPRAWRACLFQVQPRGESGRRSRRPFSRPRTRTRPRTRSWPWPRSWSWPRKRSRAWTCTRTFARSRTRACPLARSLAYQARRDQERHRAVWARGTEGQQWQWPRLDGVAESSGGNSFHQRFARFHSLFRTAEQCRRTPRPAQSIAQFCVGWPAWWRLFASDTARHFSPQPWRRGWPWTFSFPLAFPFPWFSWTLPWPPLAWYGCRIVGVGRNCCFPDGWKVCPLC